MTIFMELYEAIASLKKEKNAAILAHYYTAPEVQALADYVGDSYYLSRLAVELPQDILVLCGVSFMGESVKLLNPTKKVLLPDLTADCAMAHMATPDAIARMRETYPELAVVCYINSTAELKQYADVCVTSANAVKVVRSLPQKNIYFIPDRNLAHFVAAQVPEKNIIAGEGYCPIHEGMLAASIAELKQAHPHAPVLAHPECNPDVRARADYLGSTSGILQYVASADAEEFIIATEVGVRYPLERDFPQKRFYFPTPVPVCKDMKRITLERIKHVLETEQGEVGLPCALCAGAKAPLDAMLLHAK